MTGDRARRVVLLAWLGYAGLVTVRHVLNVSQGKTKGLPPPRIYIGPGVLFSMFYLAAGPLKMLPAVLAVGVDVAVLLNPYIQAAGSGAQPNSLIEQLTSFIDNQSSSTPGASSAVSSGTVFAPQSAPGGHPS